MIGSSAARRAPLPLLSWMESLAEPTRLRLLRLLDGHELAVAPLCEILQLPQSTVSRHLKLLGDEGFVRSRAQGTSRLYRMAPMEKDAATRRLWLLARDQTENWATARQDELRRGRLLARRQPAAQAFFARAADKWNLLRDEVYGRTLSQTAGLALLSPRWVVADLGCGAGSLSVTLAPHVARVIGVDQSAAMLRAARARSAGCQNVELRKGRLEALPLDDESCDAALVVLALSYMPEVPPVLAELARILKPGGRAVVLDLLRHDREEFRLQMGQLCLGFEADDLGPMLEEAGLQGVACRELEPEPGARGPALILATAERVAQPRLRAVPGKEGDKAR